MMFWKKKKYQDFPDFWKTYQQYFQVKTGGKLIDETRFVALDTETTGMDTKEDRILSIGAIAVNHLKIDVVDQLEMYIYQEIFKAKSVHIHGIRKNNEFKKISEFEAIKRFIHYVKDAVIVAHHANFDLSIINEALERHGLESLKNKILDTEVLFKRAKHPLYARGMAEKKYTLDDMGSDMKISLSDRHTASGDAFITAVAFLKLLPKLGVKKDDKLKSLWR